jgi:hypothetical protein
MNAWAAKEKRGPCLTPRFWRGDHIENDLSVDELQTLNVPPRLRVWRGRVSLDKLVFSILGWNVTANQGEK